MFLAHTIQFPKYALRPTAKIAVLEVVLLRSRPEWKLRPGAKL